MEAIRGSCVTTCVDGKEDDHVRELLSIVDETVMTLWQAFSRIAMVTRIGVPPLGFSTAINLSLHSVLPESCSRMTLMVCLI